MRRRSQQFLIIISIAVLWLPPFTHKGLAIDLEAAQQMARQHSDQSQVIAAQRDYNDAKARQSTAFYRPQLQGYASGFNYDSNNTNTLSASPEREITARVTATQLLFAGGRIWHSAQQQNNFKQLAELEQTEQQRTLEYDVAMSYIDAQRQQQILIIASDRLQQRQQELDDAQALFDVGSAPHLDVREAQLATQQAENDQQAAQSNLFVAITNFNHQLGRRTTTSPLTPSEIFTLQPQIDELLLQLQQQIEAQGQLNQQIGDINNEIATQQKKINNGDFWPRLSLVASANSYGIRRDSMDETTMIGVQLDWNFLNGGESQSKAAQARATMKRTLALKHQIDKQLSAVHANFHQQHGDLLQQIARQHDSVKLAEENYKDARALYMEGIITLSHLGQYNLAFAESRFTLTQLLYAHNQLFHQLQRFVSTSLIAQTQKAFEGSE